MRISDPNGLGQLASTQSGKAGETEAAKAKTGSGSARPGAAGDRVELSSFSGRISESLLAASASRAQRVAELKAAVESGSYQPDPMAVGRSIIDHSLAVAGR
jgi:negative regulator of flagellin synthesis FlgM